MKFADIVAIIVFLSGALSSAGVYCSVANKAHRSRIFAFIALFICSILILLFATQEYLVDLVSSIIMFIFAFAGCLVWFAKFFGR